jgi:hypothetical protein
MAGLYEAGRFTVLTTEPNELLRPIHDRMPALLSDERGGGLAGGPHPAGAAPGPEGVLAARRCPGG